MTGRSWGVLATPVLVAVVLGAVGGWLWWSWWAPAPLGRVYDTAAGKTWYPDPFDPGITRDFSGTATYVVLAFALAVLLGAVGGWIARHRAVAGLVAVLAGSVAAGVVMTVVGLAQSPPDPQDKAGSVPVGTVVPGHLEVTPAEVDLPGWLADVVRDDDGVVRLPTPYLAWPVGAMLAYLVVMVSFSPATSAGGSPGHAQGRSAGPASAGSPPPARPSGAPAPRG